MKLLPDHRFKMVRSSKHWHFGRNRLLLLMKNCFLKMAKSVDTGRPSPPSLIIRAMPQRKLFYWCLPLPSFRKLSFNVCYKFLIWQEGESAYVFEKKANIPKMRNILLILEFGWKRWNVKGKVHLTRFVQFWHLFSLSTTCMGATSIPDIKFLYPHRPRLQMYTVVSINDG